MIPAEAVEAAWDKLHENPRHPIAIQYSELQSALEAAAPYMLAEAFEQGQKSGLRHTDRLVAAAGIGRPELPGPMSPNPYRPTIE